MHYRRFSDDSTIRRGMEMECTIKYKFFIGHTCPLITLSRFQYTYRSMCKFKNSYVCIIECINSKI